MLASNGSGREQDSMEHRRYSESSRKCGKAQTCALVFQTRTLPANDKAVLILAARNTIQDVLVDDVTDAAGVDYIPEVQIDTLTDEDVDWIVEALDEYGLWGELAAKSRIIKAK